MAKSRKKAVLTEADKKAKRSAAAKKGWKTRRRKTALRAARNERETALNVLRSLDPIERETVLAEIGGMPDVLVERIARLSNLETVRKLRVLDMKERQLRYADEREKILKAVKKVTGNDWVSDKGKDYIRKDGSFGVVANAARHTLDDETYFNIHVVMDQVKHEYGKDSIELRDTALVLSQKHDISIREVWTILMSP